MNKTILLDFIKKYSLNCCIDSAWWAIDSATKTLTASGISPDHQILFEVKLLNFSDLPDAKFGIYNASRLKQMLSVLSDELTLALNFEGTNKKLKSILATDAEVEARIPTADLIVIEEKPALKATPTYNAQILLDAEMIDRFIKAKNALSSSGVNIFTVMLNKKDKLQIVIGHSSTNSSKITLNVNTAPGKDRVAAPIHFNSDYLKDILTCNVEFEQAVLNIGDKGLAHISFVNDRYSSEYHLVSVKNLE
jgi:hypothetical protein